MRHLIERLEMLAEETYVDNTLSGRTWDLSGISKKNIVGLKKVLDRADLSDTVKQSEIDGFKKASAGIKKNGIEVKKRREGDKSASVASKTYKKIVSFLKGVDSRLEIRESNLGSMRDGWGALPVSANYPNETIWVINQKGNVFNSSRKKIKDAPMVVIGYFPIKNKWTVSVDKKGGQIGRTGDEVLGEIKRAYKGLEK